MDTLSGSNFSNTTYIATSEESKLGYQIFFGLIIALGIPGNMLILVVYSHRRQRGKSAAGWIFLFLASLDLLACLIKPSFSLSVESGLWRLTGNDVFCRLYHLSGTMVTIASILLLSLMAADRYRRVCQPLAPSLTPEQALMVSLALVILAVVLSLLPAVLYYTDDLGVCRLDPELRYQRMAKQYYLAVFILYAVTSVVMVFLYARLSIKVCMRTRVGVVVDFAQASSWRASGTSESRSARGREGGREAECKTQATVLALGSQSGSSRAAAASPPSAPSSAAAREHRETRLSKIVPDRASEVLSETAWSSEHVEAMPNTLGDAVSTAKESSTEEKCRQGTTPTMVDRSGVRDKVSSGLGAVPDKNVGRVPKSPQLSACLTEQRLGTAKAPRLLPAERIVKVREATSDRWTQGESSLSKSTRPEPTKSGRTTSCGQSSSDVEAKCKDASALPYLAPKSPPARSDQLETRPSGSTVTSTIQGSLSAADPDPCGSKGARGILRGDNPRVKGPGHHNSSRNQRRGLQLNNDVRMILQLIVITSVFVLAWVPTWITLFTMKGREHHPSTLYGSQIYLVSHATNAFAYAIFSKAFRRNVSLLLGRRG